MKIRLTVRHVTNVVAIRTRLVLVTQSTLSYAMNLNKALFAGRHVCFQMNWTVATAVNAL
jgi:hypothetical protein